MILLCSLSVILELAWQAESPFTLNYMEKCIQDILQKYAFCIPLKKNECGFGMTYGGINDEGTLILCANYGYVNINKLKHLCIHKTPLTCTFLVRFFFCSISLLWKQAEGCTLQKPLTFDSSLCRGRARPSGIYLC